MGLFSFLKGVGKKSLKKQAAEDKKLQEQIEVKEQKEVAVLTDEVNRLGIGIEGLRLELGRQVTVYGKTNTNADREKIILALGNVEGVSCVEDHIAVTNPEPEAKFYEVQKGDTLSKIAKEQYGDAMKYPVIFEANKPMLTDPDKIYPGQVLRIPAL